MDEPSKLGKRTLRIVSLKNRHSERLLAMAMERLTAKQPEPIPHESSEQPDDQLHALRKEACA